MVGAEGVCLEMADGRKLVDGMSSWWAAIHGYNVPELNRAAENQLRSMSHVMFGGLTHAPAVELGKRLVEITPDGLDRVFLADSGSVSVEVAMKMAVQYQYARGERRRTKFLTFRGGYHGDTLGPMSVCDPETGMHGLFADFVPQHYFIDRPPAWEGGNLGLDMAYTGRLAEFVERHAGTTAAFICEPVVQGAGGMYFYHPGYLVFLREICDAHGILLIFDEIATGFGRSGELFAANHAAVVPDVLCIGKALTGGYLTLAATICTGKVAATIGASDLPNLMHGPTFMGNPLACAVAVASIDLLLASNWRKRVEMINHALTTALIHPPLHPPYGAKNERKDAWPPTGPTVSKGEAGSLVKEARVLGAIGVVETARPVDVAKMQAFFVERGVWIRPFGTRVYVMPPYVCTEAEVGKLCRAMLAACEQPELFAPAT